MIAKVREQRFPLGARLTLDELGGIGSPAYARLRVNEPVTWCAVLDSWLVTRRELVREVLMDADTFVTSSDRAVPRQVFGATMLNTDAGEHDRQRVPFRSFFQAKAVRHDYEQCIREIVDRALVAVEPGSTTIDLAPVLAPIPLEVIRSLLGLRMESTELRRVYDAFVAAIGDYSGDDAARRDGRAAMARFSADLHGELRSASRGVAAGVITRVAADEHHDLDDLELLANAMVIMFGAIETAESLLLNALYALLAHPQQLDALRADPGVCRGAIEEALRWAPPVAFVGRWASRSVTLGGVEIGGGEMVSASLVAANWDPDVFPDPERFDITRANARLNSSFSHGPHFCLGANLARLEAEIVLHAVLRRFPRLRLDHVRALPPEGFPLLRPRALPVEASDV